MADTNRNTFMRPDTMFGVCEAIGQDFGFNPLWLRLAFVPAIFFQPIGSLFAYIALGLMVLASRLFFPAKETSADSADASAVAVAALTGATQATATAVQPEPIPAMPLAA